MSERVGDWVRSYGGCVKHLVVDFSTPDKLTGITLIHYACKASAYTTRFTWESHHKCRKCVKAMLRKKNEN